MRHELKCWPEFFEPTLRGLKRFELRRNDRDFKVGDELLLKEYDPEVYRKNLPFDHRTVESIQAAIEAAYTGRELLVRVDYIMDAETLEILMQGSNQRFFSATPPDFIIMSVSLVI